MQITKFSFNNNSIINQTIYEKLNDFLFFNKIIKKCLIFKNQINQIFKIL
jgi:hypothetical protein